MENYFKGKKILITGGAGSLGKELVKRLLDYDPAVIRILDINEGEQFRFQSEMREQENLRFLIGTVRDRIRLERAMDDIDIVFHLAALKHVMSCEYDPIEAIKTNIIGIQNLIEAALDNNVERVMYTSSDKAANPNNTMGATKLLGERLMTSANYYGAKGTSFASVRFGNVMGTSGSVIPLWKYQIDNNLPLTITDPDMTRFIMSKKSALDLILKMPVIKIGDLVEALIENHGKTVEKEIIGPKPGETHYEELMTEPESERALETEDMFIIPSHLMDELSESSKRFDYPDAKRVSIKRYDSRDEKPLSKGEVEELLIKEGLI
jgi:UDP-N-acetylglucosamine 4,6-dehydratase